MKIYIVTKGEYSAYGIEAVFSTEEKAKEYIKIAGDSEEYGEKRYIEPYNVDSVMDKLVFYVRMHKDGSVDGCHFEPYGIVRNERGNYYIAEDTRHFYVNAKNKEHAIKICNERRAQMIANNEWEKE